MKNVMILLAMSLLIVTSCKKEEIKPVELLANGDPIDKLPWHQRVFQDTIIYAQSPGDRASIVLGNLYSPTIVLTEDYIAYTYIVFEGEDPQFLGADTIYAGTKIIKGVGVHIYADSEVFGEMNYVEEPGMTLYLTIIDMDGLSIYSSRNELLCG